LQLQLVATGWVAVAVVEFQVKRLDPTGPENSSLLGFQEQQESLLLVG
jgi:hypothetical protein